jgi:hypothetical protein
MKMNFVIKRADGERVTFPIEAEKLEIMHTNYGTVLLVYNGTVARVWSLESDEPPWWLKDKAQKVADRRHRRGKFVGRFRVQEWSGSF